MTDKNRIYKLDDETIDQYLSRFMGLTPNELVSEYLESEYFKDTLIECSWDIYLDWEYINDGDFEPDEGWDEYNKNQEEMEKSYREYNEKKWAKTEFVRNFLINRFDELFDMSVRYDEELDKKYHTYIFKYSNYDWDLPYLCILQDVYDYQYTKSYLLENQPSKINEPDDGIEFMVDDFLSWFFDKLYEMGCDEKVFDIIDRERSFTIPYEKILISEIHYLWDKYHIDMSIFDKNIYKTDESDKISKTPDVWTCYRKGEPASEDCKTKEEAFDDFLKDETYGFDDLIEYLSDNAPSWLKSILKSHNNRISF